MTVQIYGNLSALGNDEALSGIEAVLIVELRKIESSCSVSVDIPAQPDGEILTRFVGGSPCVERLEKPFISSPIIT